MHELAVTESMLELVVEEAHTAGAERVVAVDILLGEFSSVVEDSVRFYWDFVSKGTVAEGAELRFKAVTPRGLCLSCGAEYSPQARDLRCPVCGKARVKLVAGEEFRVEAIEVE